MVASFFAGSALVAQWIEQEPSNLLVAGSIPAGGAFYLRAIRGFRPLSTGNISSVGEQHMETNVNAFPRREILYCIRVAQKLCAPGKAIQMAKRNSWGAIRKLPHNGRFQASYIAPDGFRHNAPDTFRTKTEASNFLAGMRAQISAGKWVDPRHTTASAECPEFMEFAVSHINMQTTRGGENLRKSTKQVYLRQLSSHCKPLMGMPVDKITKQIIDKLYASITATGKLTTASKIYKLLNSIFKRAVDYGYLEENPCSIKGANNLSSRKIVTTPTPEQVFDIAEAINPRFKFLVLLCAYGGFRFGEVTELRLKDVETLVIDGERRYEFNVGRAVTLVDGRFIVDRPKSAMSIRKVLVTGRMTPVIDEYLAP
ncbi:MAG: hypothetical protein RLZZ56_923, partial [Actinomycetota bacterium]